MDNPLNDIKRFPFTDILGWSVSRYDKFKACKRQYFYDYYGKHDREYPRERINRLKAMTSVALETGNIVHDTVKTLLERLLVSEKPVNREKFYAFVRKMTGDYCAKKTFSEVYYQETGAVDPARIFEGAKVSLDNLLGSERYEWILRKAVTNKKGWVIEPPGYGETRIRGMKAYCKVDFLFPVDGDVWILDWKTGRQDGRKHTRQLLGYSSWASFHFDVDPTKINPVVVYLQPSYSELRTTFTDADVEDFVASVDRESKEMHAFCRDVEKNLPKPKEEFPQTENERVCRFCNYRELCGR